jgi:PAS domain S-box-containing protein
MNTAWRRSKHWSPRRWGKAQVVAGALLGSSAVPSSVLGAAIAAGPPSHADHLHPELLVAVVLLGVVVVGLAAYVRHLRHSHQLLTAMSEERLRTDAALHMLNRALRAVGAGGNALVRARDETSLLEEICRIAVDEAGYRLAWVGYAEDVDGERRVRPVAQRGFEDGYLDTAVIAWDDSKRGRGPTGTAIRTAQVAVARDILHDPAFAPWRDQAGRRGYASSIALPLVRNGASFGALNIYASEPDAFAGEEVVLLSRLADNLTLGIDALRTRRDRDLAMAALRDSEARFRVLVEHAPEAIVVMDLDDGHLVEVNEQAVRLFGMEREQLLQCGPADLSPERQADGSSSVEAARAYLERAAAGEVLVFEWLHRNAAGEDIPCEVRLVSLPWADRVLVRGSVTDIRERKAAQSALARSKAEFEAMFNSIPDAVVFADPQRRMVMVNPAVAKIFGYEPDLLLGRTTEMLYAEPADYRDQGEQRYRPDAQVENLPYPMRYRRKDGSVFVGETLGTRVIDADGVVIGFIAIFRDITERIEAERAVREERDRAQSYLDTVEVMLVALDPDGNVTLLNRKACELLGYTEQELLGKNWFSTCLPLREADAQLRRFRRLLAGDTAGLEYYESPVFTRAGDERMIAWRGSVLIGDDGGITGLLSSGEDITRRKQVEEELKLHRVHLEELVAERTQELSELNRELEAFSYSVSHDLRAPLRSIEGFSDALMEDYSESLDAVGREHLQRVRRAAERMDQLIADLLVLSRVSRREMENLPVDLSAIVREVVAGLQGQEPGRVVDVQVQDRVTLKGDARLLRIMMENLLGNAWKFTANVDHACVEFGCTPADDDGPVCFVRDNGAGFDPDYASKLFQPFQRLHRREEFEGTGIGLAIVNRIVRRHGGRVWAEGRPAEGAEFRFVLPGVGIGEAEEVGAQEV